MPRSLAALLLALALLPANARAYCQLTTDQPMRSTCPEVCIESGEPVLWVEHDILYTFNEALLPDLDHLLVVRQESLPDEAQVRFAGVFGTVGIRYSRENESAGSVTQYVSNSRSDGILGDGEITFHMDHTFYETPLKAIALYGLTVPASGTKTKFRNAHALYERLPEDLKRRAEGVRILHFFNYGGDHTGWQDPASAPADSPSAWQPLVWDNPETGARALWLSPLSTIGFEGISEGEGKKLVDELWDYSASIDEDLTYVHPWATGDLVIWNNRMLHHARMPFDSNEPRTLRRNSVL